MARAEDDNRLQVLREEYVTALRENESLLEQREHAALQNDVRQQDQQNPPQLFRSANPMSLSPEEVQAALPWAVELHQQQLMRQERIKEIARLMGDAGTSEKVGKHRKLVAIATGIKEDDLDNMSEELLESLQATQTADLSNGPRTPPTLPVLEVS